MTTSKLLDRESWVRTGANLIESAPYSIHRIESPSGKKYLLWVLVKRAQRLFGVFQSADEARAAAAAHEENGS